MPDQLNNIPTSFLFPPPPVRLGEFDLGGVLYHAHYFHLYEQAREAFLENGGVSYSSLVQSHSHLAVVESHQEFKSPIRYGEKLLIALQSSEITRASVIFHYKITKPDSDKPEQVVHTGWTKHIFVNSTAETFQVAKFPEELAKLLTGILK